jgi:hypothetical protein
MTSSRSLLFLGGSFSFTKDIEGASPEWPMMSYWILSSKPWKASITRTAASSSRSSRPSYPLNLKAPKRLHTSEKKAESLGKKYLYMLPDTSTTTLKTFGLSCGAPISGSCSALRLKIVFSPNNPVANTQTKNMSIG